MLSFLQLSKSSSRRLDESFTPSMLLCNAPSRSTIDSEKMLRVGLVLSAGDSSNFDVCRIKRHFSGNPSNSSVILICS
jgi:hypothetical protein